MFVTVVAIVLFSAGAFAIGTGRWSAAGAGILVAVILGYPAISTTMLSVRQSILLGSLVFATLALAVGQRLTGRRRGREVPLLFWLAVVAVSALMALTFSPVTPEVEPELVIWLTVLAGLVSIAGLTSIGLTALATALVGVELLSLAGLQTSAEQLNAIWVGRVVMIAGIVLAMRMQSIPGKVLVLTPHLAILIIIGKQGPLLGFLVAIVVWSALNVRWPTRVAIVIPATIVCLWIYLDPRWSDQAIASVDSLGTASDRVRLVDQALAQWKSAPIWGEGFGSFVGYSRNHVFTYPHNDFFEVLAELGAVGAALFIIALVSGGIYAWRNACLPLFLGCATCASVSGSFVVNHELWVVVVMCGGIAQGRAIAVKQSSSVTDEVLR